MRPPRPKERRAEYPRTRLKCPNPSRRLSRRRGGGVRWGSESPFIIATIRKSADRNGLDCSGVGRKKAQRTLSPHSLEDPANRGDSALPGHFLKLLTRTNWKKKPNPSRDYCALLCLCIQPRSSLRVLQARLRSRPCTHGEPWRRYRDTGGGHDHGMAF